LTHNSFHRSSFSKQFGFQLSIPLKIALIIIACGIVSLNRGFSSSHPQEIISEIIVDRPLYYQVQDQKAPSVAQIVNIQIPSAETEEPRNLALSIAAQPKEPEKKEANLTPLPLVIASNPHDPKHGFKVEGIKLRDSSFQIQPLGAVHSRLEDGEIYDYYHLSIDGQFNPGKDILDPDHEHRHHLRASRYILHAFPIIGRDAISYTTANGAYLITSKPDTNKDKTDYTGTIEVGLEGSIGYAAPAAATASITGHVTYTHSKTRSYQDTEVLNVSSLSAAHAEWIFEMDNFLDDDRRTSPLSLAMFSPSVQWVWKVKRDIANTRRLYTSRNGNEYFSFGLSLHAEFISVKRKILSYLRPGGKDSQTNTKTGKIKNFPVIDKQIYRLRIPPAPKSEYYQTSAVQQGNLTSSTVIITNNHQ
jgi:hypothetical protein